VTSRGGGTSTLPLAAQWTQIRESNSSGKTGRFPSAVEILPKGESQWLIVEVVLGRCGTMSSRESIESARRAEI
jgi:hypothetical protein